jgi:hypothetical protein
MAADLEASKKAVAEQIERISADSVAAPMPHNHGTDMMRLADVSGSAHDANQAEGKTPRDVGEDALEMLARMSNVSSQSLMASSFRTSLPGTSMRSASFRSVGTMHN